MCLVLIGVNHGAYTIIYEFTLIFVRKTPNYLYFLNRNPKSFFQKVLLIMEFILFFDGLIYSEQFKGN